MRAPLTAWFRVALQWDPKKRGKRATPDGDQLIVFSMLKNILCWKVHLKHKRIKRGKQTTLVGRLWNWFFFVWCTGTPSIRCTGIQNRLLRCSSEHQCSRFSEHDRKENGDRCEPSNFNWPDGHCSQPDGRTGLALHRGIAADLLILCNFWDFCWER